MSLFPIHLQSAQTADVESLASYLHRSAYEHGVLVGELVRYVLRSTGAFDQVRWPYQKPEEMVRPSATTRTLLVRLEESTSLPLGRGILWFLDGPLSLSGAEVAKGFRWCSECLAEMHSCGVTPFFKLLWHMRAVTICPLHGLRLESLCSGCGNSQDTYRKAFPLDHCQHCGQPLWVSRSHTVTVEHASQESSDAADIVRLFSDLAEYPIDGFPPDGPKVSLEKVFDHFWSADDEAALYRLIPRDTILSAISSEERMSLTVARRFAHLLGVPLSAFMEGEAHRCSGVLSASWMCELPPRFMEAKHRSFHNHDGVLRRLQRELAKKAPASLPELAKELDVSVGYLEYRYSSAVARLRLVRKRRQAALREKTLFTAKRMALQYLVAEIEGVAPLSRKQAYRKLRAETGLPKWVLKDAIRDAYAAIHG